MSSVGSDDELDDIESVEYPAELVGNDQPPPPPGAAVAVVFA